MTRVVIWATCVASTACVCAATTGDAAACHFGRLGDGTCVAHDHDEFPEDEDTMKMLQVRVAKHEIRIAPVPSAAVPLPVRVDPAAPAAPAAGTPAADNGHPSPGQPWLPWRRVRSATNALLAAVPRLWAASTGYASSLPLSLASEWRQKGRLFQPGHMFLIALVLGFLAWGLGVSSALVIRKTGLMTGQYVPTFTERSNEETDKEARKRKSTLTQKALLCRSFHEGGITDAELASIVNGDPERLACLLQISQSTGEDGAASIVDKGLEAHHLRMSPEAKGELTAGIVTLAKAVEAFCDKHHTHEPFDPTTLQQPVRRVKTVAHFLQGVNFGKAHHDMLDWTDTSSWHAAVHTQYCDNKKWGENDRPLDLMAYGILFFISQLTVFVYAWYLLARWPKEYAFIGPWVLVSRGEAMATVVITALMLLMLCRGILTKARPYLVWSVVLERILDKHILMHRALAVMLVLASALHVLGHLMGAVPTIIHDKDLSKINDAFIYGTHVPKNVSLSGEALSCWPALSGFCLVLILGAFWSFSSERVRKKCFEVFYFPHIILTVMWMCTLVVHGARQWLGIGVPLGFLVVVPMVMIYAVEWAIHVRAACHPFIRISHAVVQRRVLMLEIDTAGSGYAYKTGMYCMLRVRNISKWQWHPFTIASGDGPTVRVIMAVVGDWTAEFHELVDEAQRLAAEKGGAPIYPEINVRGGYGSAASPAGSSDIVVVGGGVGATPFLTLISSMCSASTASASSLLSRLRSARFYWVTREPDDFVWASAYQRIIDETPFLRSRISLVVCLAKALDTLAVAKCSAAGAGVFWHGAEVVLKNQPGSALEHELGVALQFGPPDWVAELRNLAGGLVAPFCHQEDHHEVSVYVFGGIPLQNSIQAACNDASGPKATFRLVAEEFGG